LYPSYQRLSSYVRTHRETFSQMFEHFRPSICKCSNIVKVHIVMFVIAVGWGCA